MASPSHSPHLSLCPARPHSPRRDKKAIVRRQKPNSNFQAQDTGHWTLCAASTTVDKSAACENAKTMARLKRPSQRRHGPFCSVLQPAGPCSAGWSSSWALGLPQCRCEALRVRVFAVGCFCLPVAPFFHSFLAFCGENAVRTTCLNRLADLPCETPEMGPKAQHQPANE